MEIFFLHICIITKVEERSNSLDESNFIMLQILESSSSFWQMERIRELWCSIMQKQLRNITID